MRWTDLPRDREPVVPAEGHVLRRGAWEDLRQRLERLPAGHPSAPGDEGDAAENAADAGWPGEGRAGDGRGRADQTGDRRASRSARSGADGRATPDGSAGHEAGHEARRTAGLDRLGQREPYRPWFTSGESPDPWFWEDPGA
jgi:hypothetical protein